MSFRIAFLVSVIGLAQGEIRERQILYGHHGDAQYFFLPTDRKPVACDSAAADEAGTLYSSAEVGDVDVNHMNFLLVDSELKKDERVKVASVLRVQHGETKEYKATMREPEDCFEIHSQTHSTFELEEVNDAGSRFYNFTKSTKSEAPGHVREEVKELCETGLYALKPQHETSIVPGKYIGTRSDLTVGLDIKAKGGAFTSETKVPNKEILHDIAYTTLCIGVITATRTIRLDNTTRESVYYSILQRAPTTKTSGLARLQRKDNFRKPGLKNTNTK